MYVRAMNDTEGRSWLSSRLVNFSACLLALWYIFSRASSRASNFCSVETRVGIACDIPAEFFERYARRAAFTSHCLLQADTDVFHDFRFIGLVGCYCGKPAPW